MYNSGYVPDCTIVATLVALSSYTLILKFVAIASKIVATKIGSHTSIELSSYIATQIYVPKQLLVQS